MSTTIQKPVHVNQKQFLVKSFPDVTLLQNAIANCHFVTKEKIQISVLEKCKSPIADDVKLCSEQFQHLKKVLHKEFSTEVKSGFFFNPEIGTIFCIGNLSPIFLQEIDDKPLGAIGTGIHGIIRGLGTKNEKVEELVKALTNGDYLLFVSARTSVIETLKQNII